MFKFITVSSSLEILLIHPDDSDNDFIIANNISIFELSKKTFSSADLHECWFSNIRTCVEEYPNAGIFLDLSIESTTQYLLAQICQNLDAIHLVIQATLKYWDRWTYSITTSLKDQMAAFFALSSYHNWSQGSVFFNEENYQIKEKFLEFSTDFKISMIESLTSVNDLVRREISKLGVNLYYVFVHPSDAIILQDSLINHKLLVSGNGIIYTQASSYGCNYDGALIVTEADYEYYSTLLEYIEDLIINTIGFITKNTPTGSIQEVKLFLESLMPSHYSKRNFSLVNIQNGKRAKVGSITNNQITIFSKIIFPGNTTLIPKSAKKMLNFSISAGTTNPGSQSSMTQKLGSMGAYALVQKINEGNDLLPNFNMNLFSFDCGVTLYNANFAKTCFRQDFDKIGLAHLTSYGSLMAIGTMKTFFFLNITVPSIGSTNGDPSLSSVKNYPMYVRVVSSVTYNEGIVLIKALGWKKAAILYENSSWGISIYTISIKTAKSVDLEFINPENLRAVPPILDRNSIRNYKYLFQSVIDSHAMLFIMVFQCPMCNYALELFYDLGLRKGDIVVYSHNPDPLDFISTADSYLYKRKEIGCSMTRLVMPVWLGEVGQDALKRIWSTYNTRPTTLSCYYFDSAYLLAHALDYMINRGQDYTDPINAMQAIRNQRFLSCSGYVLIEQNPNDRLFDAYQFDQVTLNQTTGNLSINIAGYLKPFSTQLIYILNPLIYPDGTMKKPSDLRNVNDDCPFPKNKIKTFAKGRGLLFGICFTSAFIAGIVTIVIKKKLWNFAIIELLEPEASFQDFIVAATIFIESFQFASMGPDFSVLSTLLYSLTQLTTIDLENFIKFEKGMFWIIVNIVFCGIWLWVLLCIVILLRLHEKYDNLWVFRNLGLLGENLMPILGNLCFIPFISICLDIFQCDQSIGDNFTESFLSKDCYCFCWKEEHLTYAIISFICLLAYQPLAVLFRPLWQELQLMLHVKALPLYLMVKSIAQIALIVLNKTIKRTNALSHGITFIFIMSLYVWYILVFKAFNYGRFNLWQALSLIAVIWLAFLSTFILVAHGNTIVYFLLLIIGWIFIGVFGIFVQKKKYPSLLFKKKVRNEYALFRFAFNFRSSIYSIDELYE
ncbi:unnamed protein product [Blepharisma stoltei]|uniref:Receptor ligand binding region domain-containing protein n=1 Tax=Blepharisma stoltei TaxID=1481888 RepID=A0AAU9J1F1_9CILI|nr:unnamed protein product [Blepharisma stoltei]